MKKMFVLVGLVALFVNCTEAPNAPDDNLSETIVGMWGGISEITYPGPDDGPLTNLAKLLLEFKEDGSFNYSERYSMWAPPVILYTGSYVVSGQSVTLNLEYDFLVHSPLDLSGSFQVTVDNKALRLYRKSGWEFPVIRDIQMVQWVVVEPTDPEAVLLGPWLGWSHITYPGPVDEPHFDSLEIHFTFYADYTFSYGWVGDEISYPTRYDGTWEVHLDKIFLVVDEFLPYSSPLDLKGEFTWQVTDETLSLYQHPEQAWPTIHVVRLSRSPMPL